MVARKEKQGKKYRGFRTHGTGNPKNKRGHGNKGGVGNAGLSKHKKTWAVKFAPDHFGTKGFVPPLRKKQIKLNIFDLENKVKKGAFEKKDGKFLYTFKGKILGSGELTVPMHIKALSWSKKAEEKIKQAGGEIEKFSI